MKAKDVLLRVLFRAIHVRSRSRHEDTGSACPRCGIHESIPHCFTQCHPARTFSASLSLCMSTFFGTKSPTDFQLLLFSPAHKIHNKVWQLLQATVLRHIWLERCNALNNSPSPPPAVTAHAILSDFEAALQGLLHNLVCKSTIRSLRKLKHLSRFLLYDS